MKKALAIIANDEMLSKFNNEFEALGKTYNEKMMFLKKQNENIHNDAQKKKMEIWARLEVYMKDKNILPADYNKETQYLCLNHEAGLVMIGDKKEQESEDGMPDFIKKFLGMLILKDEDK